MAHVNMSMRLDTFVGMSKVDTYGLIMVFIIICYMLKRSVFNNRIDSSGSMRKLRSLNI